MEKVQCLLFVISDNSSKTISTNGKKFVICNAAEKEVMEFFELHKVPVLDSLDSLALQAAKDRHLKVLELIVVKYGGSLPPSQLFYPISVDLGNEEIVQQIFGTDVAILNDSIALNNIVCALDENNAKVLEHLLNQALSITYENFFGETLLHLAVHREDEILVELLVKYGVDLNAKTRSNGLTPFQNAVQDDRLLIARLLLEKGASVNEAGLNGITALCLAIYYDNIKMVKLCLNNGVNVNLGQMNGFTPLHLAVNSGQREIVDSLLKAGAFVNASATYCHADGVTPLCLAVEEGNTEIAKCLLENGAAVNIPCYDNETILKLAVDRQLVDMIEIILKYQPDVNDRTNQKVLSECVSKGGEKLDKIAQMLFQYGFNVDVECENSSLISSLLHNAIRKNYINAVERLLKSGVSANKVYRYYDDDLKDFKKTVPLLTAIKYQQNDIVKLLVNSGADIYLKLDLKDSETPITMAEDNFEFLKILLASNLKCNCSGDAEAIIRSAIRYDEFINNDSAEIIEKILEELAVSIGQSSLLSIPVHCAIRNSSLAVLKKLVSLGFGVNSADENGLTFLHYATDKDCSERVPFLVKNNANLEARCLSGQTPIFKAVQNGYSDVVKELLKYGARIDLLDYFDRSPIHYAIGEGVRSEKNKSILVTLLRYAFENEFVQKANIFKFFRHLYPPHDDSDAYLDSQFETSQMEFVQLVIALYKAVIKLKVAFLNEEATTQFFKENLEPVFIGAERPLDFQDFNERLLLKIQVEYRKEINQMKCQMVGTTSVSYYDILTKDVHRLARYTANSSIVAALNSSYYESKFPRYRGFLSKQFKSGLFRKQLLDQTIKSCHLLVSQFQSLPLNLKEDILSYLSNSELEVVVYACSIVNASQSHVRDSVSEQSA